MSLKYFVASFVDDIQHLAWDWKAKRINGMLEKFEGLSCVVSVGYYNEEDGSFDVREEHQVQDLHITYSYMSHDSPILYDGFSRYITSLSDPSGTKRIFEGDGVIFNQDGGYDIMITEYK